MDDDDAEKKRTRAERKPSNLKKEKKKPRSKEGLFKKLGLGWVQEPKPDRRFNLQ